MSNSREFLVDRHKHRIVKRDGVWKFYCPFRGPDGIIFCMTFAAAIFLLLFQCPHIDFQNRPIP